MSFGKKMVVKIGKLVVVLKPFTEEEITSRDVLEMLSDYMVTRYTSMQTAPTAKDESSFFERARTDKETFYWGVYLKEGKKLSKLLGSTSLHIVNPNHMGSTGFVMWDKTYWRKGIASTAHIGRTHYAANHLGLRTIVSGAMQPNIGSIKALQSVGYFITGYKLADDMRDGQYLHHVKLQWFNPVYEDLLTQDLPEEVQQKAKEGIAKATQTLQKAKKAVSYE